MAPVASLRRITQFKLPQSTQAVFTKLPVNELTSYINESRQAAQRRMT